MQNIKLQNELNRYKSGESEFIPYYEGMNILSSNESDAKSFKMYLDTVIINMHTKAKKYKQSIYFENESIKDIVNQGYHIPFYIDEKRSVYVLLGIVKI